MAKLRLRWWHWVLAASFVLILALLTAVIGYRASGRSAYQRFLSERHASGRPVTLDQWQARLPPLDRASQDAWWTWEGVPLPDWSSIAYPEQKDWAAWIGGVGSAPEPLVRLTQDWEPRTRAACVLLDRGQVVLSALAWADQELPATRRTLGAMHASRRFSYFLAYAGRQSRHLAEWLRHVAVLSPSPDLALRRLDRLVERWAVQPSLLDAMSLVSIAGTRDRAHVELAMRGTLPADHGEAWLAEPSPMMHWVADGLDAEAVVFLGCAAGSLDGGSLRSDLAAGMSDPPGLLFTIAVWATGFQDCVTLADYHGWAADRAGGLRPDAPPQWDVIRRRLGPWGRSTLTSPLESMITGASGDAGHRAARLAVRLIDLARTTGLPADQASVGFPDLLQPPGDHLWLRYVRISERRFRIDVDPATPVPNFFDPARLVLYSQQPTEPLHNEPFFYRGGTGRIELTVPPLP